jgi:hypothetical protein
VPLRLALALSLLLLSAGCAASRAYTPPGEALHAQPAPGHSPQSPASTRALSRAQASNAPRASEADEPATSAHRAQVLADGRLRLLLPPPPPHPPQGVHTQGGI